MEIQRRKRVRKSQWINLLSMYNHRCYYCNSPIGLIQEHFIPLIRGGSNEINNIVPACDHCNKTKGTSTGGEYLKWMKFLYFSGLGPKPVAFCQECGRSRESKVFYCEC